MKRFHIWMTLLWTVLGQQLPLSTWQPSDTIKSTNLTDLVQWDGYSLFVKHQRITLWSGEIHPWRILNPDLYLDVMQRIKALGFNAISMYTFWGLHNPSPGVLDLEGWKDLDPFFEAANQAGLWVVARPGPYINAEVAGGGIPGWVIALNVTLRTSDPVFKQAYRPYWEAVGRIFEKYQITNNGPIIGVQIENEYFLDDDGSLDLGYIEDLEASMRSYGIVVPLTFNDVGQEKRLVTGRGAVDIYGVDSYPQNADCSDPTKWHDVQTSFRHYLQETAGKAGSPFYIPEFQGGWIPGIDTVAYEQCQKMFNSAFQDIFYLGNIAQGVRMHNIYMVYGGTNYGHTVFPRGITSYDYWSAIAEDRSLKEEYRNLKTLSHFVRSNRDLAKTWVVGSSASTYTTAQPETIRVDELRNPNSHAGFYVVRHETSSSLAYSSFDIILRDSIGRIVTPFVLDGRESFALVTDYQWGTSRAAYTTMGIFTSLSRTEYDLLVLHGQPGRPYRLAFPTPGLKVSKVAGSSSFQQITDRKRTALETKIKTGDHLVLLVEGAGKPIRVHVVDTSTVQYAWETVVPGKGPFGSHYGIGSNDTVLVFGPHFVRSASYMEATGELQLEGDLISHTKIRIEAPSTISSFAWNGKLITATLGSDGLWKASLAGPDPTALPATPEISNWRWADSLPEIQSDFDDSDWVVADHLTTTNPNQPYVGYAGQYVLYLQDYGYAVGNTILRGHFNATGKEQGFMCSVSAGTGGAAAFWLNGQYRGSALVDKVEGVEDVNATIHFPPGALVQGENILQIVLDNAALEENNKFSPYSSDIQSPRGLRGYSLLGGDESGQEVEWRVQGNKGGWSDFPDRTRSIFNTGGLAGERQGWHLPGFNDTDWAKGSSALEKPGVRFYRADLEVEYPAGLDIHYNFVFPNSTGAYRAMLFVNGWQFGKRYGDYGPQLVFPVPPGILIQGHNTIALSLFAMNDTIASFSLGGPLTVLISANVTTTSLELSRMRVDSPTWGEVFGQEG